MRDSGASGRGVASQRPSLAVGVSRERLVASSPNCARWFTPAILGREATQRKDPRLWTIWRLEARGWKLEALEPVVAWLQHVRASPDGKQREQAPALHTIEIRPVDRARTSCLAQVVNHFKEVTLCLYLYFGNVDGSR